MKTEKLEHLRRIGDEASPGSQISGDRRTLPVLRKIFCLFTGKSGMFCLRCAISSSEDVFADLPGFADTCPHSGIEHFFIAQAVCAEQLPEHRPRECAQAGLQPGFSVLPGFFDHAGEDFLERFAVIQESGAQLFQMLHQQHQCHSQTPGFGGGILQLFPERTANLFNGGTVQTCNCLQ